MPLTLHVEIDAETGQFKGAVKGAGADLKKFGDQGEQTGRRLRRTFEELTGSLARAGRRLSLGLTAATAGMFLLSRRSIATADELGKTADRIGLNVEALQELRFAAGRTGVDLEVFNQGLTAMVRRAGEAQQGNEEFAKGFRAVGLSAEDLRRLKPEEILREVADGLARIPNEAERVAAADRIFSEAGRRMINLLRLQSRGLDEMADTARRLGVVLSEDIVRRAEQANDELSDMSQVFRVAGLNLGLELMPVMRELAHVLTDPAVIRGVHDLGLGMRDLVRWSTENSDTLLRIIGGLTGLSLGSRFGARGAIVGALLGAGFTPEALKMLGAELKGVDETLGSISRKSAAGAGGEPSFSAGADGFEKMRAQIADLRFEAELLTTGVSESVQEAARAARSAGLVESFDEIVKGSDKVQNSMVDFAQAFERLRDLRDVASIVESIKTPQEKLNDQLARLAELKPQLTAEQYGRAVAAAKDEVQKTSEEQNRLNKVADQFSFTFVSAFEDAAIAGQDLRSVMQGLLEDIERMILQIAILEPLGDALRGAFRGIAAGGAGGGGGAFGFISSLFAERGGVIGRDAIPTRRVPALAFAGAPRLQSGGIVGGGIPAILHPGEEVLPPGHPRHANNAGGVNVYISAPPGTQPRVDRRRGPGGSIDLHVVLDEGVANAINQPGSRTRAALQRTFGVQHRLIARA